MMTKKRVLFLAGVFLCLVAIVYALWVNQALELNTITVDAHGLPSAFDGYRIAHVSDLHGAEFGKDNEDLLAMLREAKPDLIAMTGDMMDQRMTDVDSLLTFAAQAVTVAPCYYITGNHEVRLPQALYRQLLDGLDALGVRVLVDEAVLLEREDQVITLVGHAWGPAEGAEGLTDFSGYRILLSHPPEDMAAYSEAGYDLVLSGHAHGGQFRLPGLGGIYAPGQGFFPQYDSGQYILGDTVMIVSRGLGNSTIPIRLNNRPEVILVVLKAENG